MLVGGGPHAGVRPGVPQVATVEALRVRSHLNASRAVPEIQLNHPLEQVQNSLFKEILKSPRWFRWRALRTPPLLERENPAALSGRRARDASRQGYLGRPSGAPAGRYGRWRRLRGGACACPGEASAGQSIRPRRASWRLDLELERMAKPVGSTDWAWKDGSKDVEPDDELLVSGGAFWHRAARQLWRHSAPSRRAAAARPAKARAGLGVERALRPCRPGPAALSRVCGAAISVTCAPARAVR